MPAAYPPDALMRDGLALIAHLGLTDYDLGGYSLGARTTVRMLANGATPRRVVLSGMGLTGIVSTAGARRVFPQRPDEPRAASSADQSEWMTEAFLKTTGGDPVALLHILDTFVDTDAAGAARDRRSRPQWSAGPRMTITARRRRWPMRCRTGRTSRCPGNHMSAVVKPELGPRSPISWRAERAP